MSPGLNAPSIGKAISYLYETAEIELPNQTRSITPLGDLIGSLNLICTELPSLTEQAACHYLLRRGGLIEPPVIIAQDPLAGYLYANESFGCIFVESTDILVRRRFSVAHELGHYLLHFQPLLVYIATRNIDRDLLEITDSFPQTSPNAAPGDLPIGAVGITQTFDVTELLPPLARMEREANEFAVEILMPRNVIEGLVARYRPHFLDDDLVRRLSTDMLVSQATMHWRLFNLGFTPSPTVTYN